MQDPLYTYVNCFKINPVTVSQVGTYLLVEIMYLSHFDALNIF